MKKGLSPSQLTKTNHRKFSMGPNNLQSLPLPFLVQRLLKWKPPLFCVTLRLIVMRWTAPSNSLIAQLVMQCRRPQFDSWVRKICWKRDRLPTPVLLGFPCGSAGKESACSVGDLGSIPGLGRSPGEEKGYPFQYSDLENSMDCIVHGIAKSWTRLSDLHLHLTSLSAS